MAHDVFISHSARDKPYADAVCAKLESQGVRCWIAPRDIRPGMDWGAAILEAIDGARVMLLVFSSHANSSPQIKREVERAVNKELIVVPVRVEDVKPTGNLEYFLGTPHWLDAITPPFERHLDRVADSAKFWLKRIESDGATFEATRPAQPVREEPSVATSPVVARARTRPKWIAPSIVALVIALIGTAAFFGARYYVAQQQFARERAVELAADAERAREAAQHQEQAAAQERERAAEQERERAATNAERRKRAAAAQAQKDAERKSAQAQKDAEQKAAQAQKELAATEAQAKARQAPAPAAPAPKTNAGPGPQLSMIAVSGLKSLGGDDDHSISSQFDSTLRRDLDLSGYFRTIDPHAYIEDAQSSGFELGQFSFADWKSINGDFVVKGSIVADGSAIKLTAYLYDVAQQRRMMGKNYAGGVDTAARMARRFADSILESITGQKGPFDSKLAFVSTRGGGVKEIYTQSIDGQDLFKLTDNPSLNLSPSFDRSTRYVLYLSEKSGEPALYLADLEERREMRLVSPHGRIIGGTILPDAEQFVAAVERGGVTNLYLITREGAEIRQLTDTNGINVSPAISPDGQTMAFTSDRSGNPQIYLMPLTGGAAKRITFSGDYNTTPVFSPNGDQLAYQSRAAGRFDIWTIALSGGEPVQITEGNGSNEYPSWSPDGRYLAFSSTRDLRSRIYIIMVGNRKIISALTEGNGDDSCPVWSWRLGD